MKYAISDIHGCAKTFKKLLTTIDFSITDQLYLLGDYIDRGPDSKGVIDLIRELQIKGHQVFCLKGNHEQMMLDSKMKELTRNSWLIHGGKETLASFGVDTIDAVPVRYLDWMENLPHYLEVDAYILVHAGLNFQHLNPLEDELSMLWARGWYKYINPAALGDRIVLHGHTPIRAMEIRAGLENVTEIPAINIDNGCVYDREDMGELCAFDLEAQRFYFQKRID